MISYGTKKALLAAGAGLFLASCASTGTKTPVDTGYRGAAEIEQKIASATMTAAKAQENLARVQIARTKPAPLPLDESNLPPELLTPATINWTGPAHEAAKRIAALIGYSFAVTGNPPAIPPSVNISLVDVPAAKALENIGLQAFPFGEVSVDPNVKRVEFRYLQQHQQPRSVAGSSPKFGK
ncbi:DotD/TraH family lipoprotein [Mesorhizobium sp. SP-1A]|uniref:DotD/TraH family lipoprotein n=1 Tax=Mesorhizobium sp. SP-1A TaxID=3077840 RepID=UPI0028F7333D|nr:DotD/TraH family lipoprotein [Mesorhizobium sp. SP-1A]